jgi:hypothetical protein
MNYDQRISFLKQWFKDDIVSRFNMPRDLDPTVVAMDVIDAINRNIPDGITHERLSSLVAPIAKEVTQSARTRTLPSVKEFLEAMRNTHQSYGEARQGASSASFDDYQLNANRIRQQNAVSDMYLRDPHRKKLIEEYNLTEKDFEPYDKWFATAAHKQ